MLKSTSLTALQGGQQVEVSPGDILEVEVGFDYRLTEPAQVELWLSLVIPPGRDYTVKQQVSLDATDGATQAWTGSIQMPIEASGLFGILKNYTYDLYFEIPYCTSEVAIAEDAVIITGIVGGILETMLPMMIIIMMMTMMMPMMAEEGD